MTDHSPAARPSASTALADRRARIRALRLRVATLSVTVFLAAWGIVFGQLVTGRDPALARDVAPVSAQSADPSATTDRKATVAGDTASSAGTTAPAATAAAVPQPEPVVTRQS